MIIIEGPDGSGKSTLCEMLAERYGLQIGERSSSRENLYQTTVGDSYSAVGRAIMGYEPPAIWDRLFYSDPVYARIVRKERSQFTHDQIVWLHSLILVMGCPVVLCLPPISRVRENVMASDQMDGVVENTDNIYQAYRMMMNFQWGHRPQLLLYNYTSPIAYEGVCRRIDEYLVRRNNRREFQPQEVE